MYFASGTKIECCGCTACKNICPVSAIVMQEDNEGFQYPIINKDLCVNCKLCEKVCPLGRNAEKIKEEKRYDVFAAILKDETQRRKSSSGGAFYAIANTVIKKDGVVFGASFDEKLVLKHIGVATINDLESLRGSKYLQSCKGSIYKEVRTQLNSGRLCYFVGTGCEVAGLKSFLMKDYPNLLTSDIVCHGVPSQKLFDNHISFMEQKYHDKVVGYQFRNLDSWGGCETVHFANRKSVINPTYMLSPYLYSFMYAMTYRPSCYYCKFAKIPRTGDITLADFWGVEHCGIPIDTSKGVSLVIVNNQKGKEIWKEVNADFEWFASDIEHASAFNGNVIRPSERPDIRETIYKIIEEEGYEYAVRKYFRHPQHYYLKIRSFLSPLKRKLKDILS